MAKRYIRTLPAVEAMQCLESNVDEFVAWCDGMEANYGVMFSVQGEFLPSNLVRFGDWLVLYNISGERRFNKVSDEFFRSQYKELEE